MINSSRFPKGHIPWNKGLTAQVDERIRKSTEAAHNAVRGAVAWNKGLTKQTDRRVAKYAIKLKGMKKPWQAGENHPNWKNALNLQAWNKGKKLPHLTEENSGRWVGDDVRYSGLHMWVRSRLGTPDTCEHCGKSRLAGRQIHWANKSGEYR